MALAFFNVETVRGLFHDRTTRGAGVEFWVTSSMALLLLRYAAGSTMRSRLMASSRRINPGVQLLRILSYYSVSYTLGLMQPSSSSDDDDGTGASAAKDLFQVWAVLIVTMQESVSLGRPYKPHQMSMVDLLSSLWSANQLIRGQTAMYLTVPLWLIWSIQASRIIWYYVSSDAASSVGADNMKLISDYMASSQHTADDAKPETMEGYRYFVLGEDQLEKEIERSRFRLRLDLETRPEDLVTLEKVWGHGHRPDTGGGGGGNLLGNDSDNDKLKDVCLSFALYKLLRRRFFDFPIPEAKHQAMRRLVFEAILEEGADGGYERAFRVTEVELSFLQDFSYSKHAVVFARGFPVQRVILSLLMTSAASYLAYAVHDVPSATTAVVASGRVARISHGVFITRWIIAIIICRELWEIGVFVLSQWTKVLVICHYIRLQKREGEGCMMEVLKALQRLMMKAVARFMFPLICRGRWDQRIHQYNLLLSAARDQTQIGGKLIPRCRRTVKMDVQVKRAMFEQLKQLSPQSLRSQFKKALAGESRIKRLFSQLDGVSVKSLGSYFDRAFGTFGGVDGFRIKLVLRGLDGETHKILVWHIATTLCQIKLQLLEEEAGRRRQWDMYTMLPKQADGRVPIPACCRSKGSSDDQASGVWQDYVTVGSLSNYCAYLVTKALVPETGLVANKVLDKVSREARAAVCECSSTAPRELYEKLIAEAMVPDWKDGPSIVIIGARLSLHLMSMYGVDKVDLWRRLAMFWARFLLHLSANTTAAKHRVHLQGSNGELATHLWALLSHAGFLGTAAHGHQMLDPDDLNDAAWT